jgi:hypothetical protein
LPCKVANARFDRIKCLSGHSWGHTKKTGSRTVNLRDRMQVKLTDAQQEVRTLSVMALNPSLPPECRQLLKVLESLARTEAKLRRRALEYQLALDQHGLP